MNETTQIDPRMLPLPIADPAVAEAIRWEEERLEAHIELIASENVVSLAVLQATGSVMTNKYAEGYPGKRYYGGCTNVDVVEELARKRACELFGVEHANVQPHSGAQANLAVYSVAMEPGDTYLAMSLSEGGHLTHGSPVNFSGSWYKPVHYGVSPETGRIDMAEVARLAEQHRPRLIVAGASCYARILDFAEFRRIADSVGARLMVDMAHIAGLVAAGEHPSPVPHAHFVTTTTHKTLRGPRGGMILTSGEYAQAIDKAVFPGMQGGPLMHVIAAKAVSLLEAQQPAFRTYQAQVRANAAAIGRTLMDLGWSLVSGGTDNHLIWCDLRPKGSTGRSAEVALDAVGITVNRNMIPGDPAKPWVTSGIRIGSPAVTSRGFTEAEMAETGRLVDLCISHPGDEALLAQVRADVRSLTARFPLRAAGL